ncbi:MAG: sigma-70 family RNA polymerase sigma factor [Phycisphaerales bacterium]|nr:MAG: sigma-70 family RNA polymerase sigma factor [Phycisphaerales bacterium]
MPEPGSAAAGNSMNPEFWLEEHGDCLFAYAAARVRDESTAEDLVQETLLAALESWATFAGKSSVRTWLVGILKNKILQHYRKDARQGGEIPEDLDPAVVEEQFNRLGKWKKSPAGWGRDPEKLPESDEFRRVLRDCLARLPGRVSEAFVLAEQHCLSTEKLCQILKASATNIYAMLYRARTALRTCLEHNWFRGKAGKEC